MEEIIKSLLNPVIIGTVALFTFVTVQGIKVFGLIKEGQEGKFALGSAAVVGVLLAIGEFVPSVTPFVGIGLALYVGTLVGGLFYKYIAKPVVEAFVGNISTKELG